MSLEVCEHGKLKRQCQDCDISEELQDLKMEIFSLAKAIHREFYEKSHPDFEISKDVNVCLSQIDNMIFGTKK